MGDWRERYTEVVETPEQCVAFVEAVGVCAWLSPLGCGFPNLAETMSIPSNTVINETWFWKDDLHIEKRLFYGKLLGGQAAFASLEFLPTLIAAQGDVDPHNLHEQGLLSDTTLRAYEALMEHRELTTADLKLKAKLASPDDKTAYEKATAQLTALFQICKTGITGRTRGTYGYVWGLVEDWLPDVLAKASEMRPESAAQSLQAHLESMDVHLTSKQWKKLFGFEQAERGA